VIGAYASVVLGTAKTSGKFWLRVLQGVKQVGWRSPLRRHIKARLLLLLMQEVKEELELRETSELLESDWSHKWLQDNFGKERKGRWLATLKQEFAALKAQVVDVVRDFHQGLRERVA
jgi:hypothetical protein